MKQIRTTIESPYEPNDNGVLWLDTSNPDAPILKAFTNGKWQATSGTGTEPVESAANKVTEISAESTDVEYPSAKAVYEALESATEVIEGTWAEIKALRDNRELVPGRLYKITNYEATSCQIFTDARRNFGVMPRMQIVLIAATNKAFFEKGFGFVNGATYDIWYCIDNDSKRFHWAADTIIWSNNITIGDCLSHEPLSRDPNEDLNTGTYKYAWGYVDPYNTFDGYLYTESESPKVGDPIYNPDTQQTGTVSEIRYGTGVISRMIDANNNDIGYDFLSIIFERFKILSNDIIIVEYNYNYEDVANKLKSMGSDITATAFFDYPKSADYYSDTIELSDENYYITLYENSGGDPLLIGMLEDNAPEVSEFYYYTLENRISKKENSKNCKNVHIVSGDYLPNSLFIADKVTNVYLDETSRCNTFSGYNINQIEFKGSDYNSCVEGVRLSLDACHGVRVLESNNINIQDGRASGININSSSFINIVGETDDKFNSCDYINVTGPGNYNWFDGANGVVVETECVHNYISGSWVHVLPGTEEAEITEDSVWVGHDSNGVLRIWNPADPTGT